MGTSKQSGKHQSVIIKKLIDILMKSNLLWLKKAPSLLRGTKEGYDLMTHVTELGWQLNIYPNELNVESMHDHQLLGNDTEPNNYTQVSNGSNIRNC